MYTLHHYDREDGAKARPFKPLDNGNRMGLLLLGVGALCIGVYLAFFFAA
ncbi:hypothetical protein ABI_19600 [Asticcacaulis biprosthecium C19]|uniref:Uncharacterized protein n=1 Tax=Asticcacaulis biprosthecium C19 TaxID=715226 RepID=F4QLM2_9CAUL|nr:hypothetical protein [Asticcacaulis biprosthecium]EGF93520.1 hypothetical protein ABI_19600 [Asticcacaulis biprosthecium C19]